MNREQKTAWICVICMLLIFVIALTVLMMHFLTGSPKVLYAAAIPWLGPLLSLIICVFIPKDKGKIIRDERDIMIRKNAAHAGFIGAFLFTCVACLTPFFVLGPDAAISVKWLPHIWTGTFIAQFFFYSLTIIVDYGRASKGEKS